LSLIVAFFVCASIWLGIFKLLLDIRRHFLAFFASERTYQKLWLGIGGSGDSTVNCHQSAENSSFQVPNFIDLSQVVKPNLVQSLLVLCHWLPIVHENSESFPQIGLIPVELLQYLLWKVCVLVIELSNVSVIDVHVHLVLL
jgi:hypothetical protein